jgi:hypothetical protein
MSQIVSKPRVSLQFDPGRGRRDGDTSHLRGAIRDIRAELCASTLLYCRGEQEQHRPTSTLYGHAADVSLPVGPTAGAVYAVNTYTSAHR